MVLTSLTSIRKLNVGKWLENKVTQLWQKSDLKWGLSGPHFCFFHITRLHLTQGQHCHFLNDTLLWQLTNSNSWKEITTNTWDQTQLHHSHLCNLWIINNAYCKELLRKSINIWQLLYTISSRQRKLLWNCLLYYEFRFTTWPRSNQKYDKPITTHLIIGH